MSTRAQWMADGSFGLMVHYLPGGTWPETGKQITDVNTLADQFNLDAFMAGFDASGADWLIFTIGQNTGFYLSPNSLLDQWAGPGHCSRRDLIAEIAAAVQARGKRFIAYLPCEVRGNVSVQEAFGWDQNDGTSQPIFQDRYTRFIRKWAARWGRHLDGWWFDGCYDWPHFQNSKMDWPLWYEALRAGNPDAVLTFNDGSFCCGVTVPVRPEHDYTSGEVEQLRQGKIVLGRNPDVPLYLPEAQIIKGTQTQWHALVPIDAFWAHRCFTAAMARNFPNIAHLYQIIPENGPAPMELPIYSNADLEAFLRSVKKVSGAVTFNVGIYQEGHMAEKSIAQLKKLKGI